MNFTDRQSWFNIREPLRADHVRICDLLLLYSLCYVNTRSGSPLPEGEGWRRVASPGLQPGETGLIRIAPGFSPEKWG